MTQAWMLRQDGEAFDVRVHLYAMGDEDLASEAEVASFLISTDSKDQDLAEEVLDGWMAKLIAADVSYDDDSDTIAQKIYNRIMKVPYKFPYPLEATDYINIHHKLGNYYDVDSYYEYIDRLNSQLVSLQTAIRISLNQQFSRVRFGGVYNEEGSNAIWCRVSSTNFNWANTFYLFIASKVAALKITAVSICRDPESDDPGDTGDIEYFYKAKDGRPYYLMPIEEYLGEEHEHSPVFSSSSITLGVIRSMRVMLASGASPYTIMSDLASNNIMGTSEFYRTWNRFVANEQMSCIEASEYFDTAPTRTKTRLQKMMRAITKTYPEIEAVDISAEPYESLSNKRTGIKYMFELESSNELLDHVIIDVAFTKPEPTTDEILRFFRREYLDYKRYMKIK